ncbi:hypothetical protein CEUSTIGMA_g464.t1 [Chlamydomonas eustigma]|uniref:NAD(P)-binding domain-containing protein n=1 Tax=Chlamydomonas eustigma TaxID=1157962 RepID=A0A250WQR6_9CHLO|nr:hypothetical protein CEUSTIGMA_g464.t1 [Chlamydomonas eustigma]|eukprot:GAX73012.1 hypothetical protein CEUSTIGMA_g464.t1 [Chlamydomonas eustigma]
MMNILVASASAKTGCAVVEILSAQGTVKIKALVRNPSSNTAKSIAALPNVSLVVGDFNDVQSIKDALHGVDRATLLGKNHSTTERLITLCNEIMKLAFIAAATEAGVEAVVRISTYGALIGLNSTGVTGVYAKAHARIEQYIEDHDSKQLAGSAAEAKATGHISMPVADNTSTFAMIDPRDVAGAAVAILVQPTEKLQQFLSLRQVQVHRPERKSF